MDFVEHLNWRLVRWRKGGIVRWQSVLPNSGDISQETIQTQVSHSSHYEQLDAHHVLGSRLLEPDLAITPSFKS